MFVHLHLQDKNIPLQLLSTSGLPQLRFVDIVASQLEEKPGAKNWPGGKKGQNWGKMEKGVGLRGGKYCVSPAPEQEKVPNYQR